MWVAGDTDGEGVAGDGPGDVVGEGGVGGAAGVGVAGGGDAVGAAGVALLDGVSCVALVVRVLLVMVLGVAPAIPGGGPGCWFTGPGGAGCLSCRRVPLVMLMVGLVQMLVLLMTLASVLWVLYRVMLRVGVVGDAAGGSAAGDGDFESAAGAAMVDGGADDTGGGFGCGSVRGAGVVVVVFVGRCWAWLAPCVD